MRSDSIDLRSAMRLYAVTDSRWLKGERLADRVAAAIEGGATFVQLREKEAIPAERLALAGEIGALCRERGIPFVVDDDVETALRAGADGVHVGQSDEGAAQARLRLGPDKILGVSAQTVEQALEAERAGADYLGVGAVFPTGSKEDADAVSLAELKKICAAVRIPVVAIGGIGLENLGQLKGSGIAGVAVISALFAQPDTERAARTLRQALEDVL